MTWWLIVLAPVLVEAGLARLLGWLAPELPIRIVGIISGALLAALAAGVLIRLRWWHETGMIGGINPRRLLWFVPFALYGLLPLLGGVRASGVDIALGAVAGVSIAFWKFAVLALLLRTFSAVRVWRRVGLTALLFGLMHLGGLLVGGDPPPTALLSLSYLLLGFGAGAVAVRTARVWPLVVCTALLLATATAVQDPTTPNLVVSAEGILPAVIISALLAVYGLVVLGTARR